MGRGREEAGGDRKRQVRCVSWLLRDDILAFDVSLWRCILAFERWDGDCILPFYESLSCLLRDSILPFEKWNGVVSCLLKCILLAFEESISWLLRDDME